MPDVQLRPATRTDAAELIEANRQSRSLHHPWVAPCTDQASFDAWLDRALTGPTIRLIAREAATSALVGVVSLSEIVLGPLRSAYLGFYGNGAITRRGLMTEAVREGLRHGFGDVGLHRVEANIQPANARSVALVRRLGFRLEGVSIDYLFIDGAWRSCERWALLDREFEHPS